MIITNRYFNHFEEEALDSMNRKQLYQRALHMKDVLGLKEEPPHQQHRLKEWIIAHQAAIKSGNPTTQTKLLTDPHAHVELTVNLAEAIDTEKKTFGSGKYASACGYSAAATSHTGRKFSYQEKEPQLARHGGEESHLQQLEWAKTHGNQIIPEKDRNLLRRVAVAALTNFGSEVLTDRKERKGNQEKELEKLVGSFKKVTFKKGDIVLREDTIAPDSESTLLMLVKGEYSISKRGKVESMISESGTYVGEMSLLYRCPMTYTVRAEKDCEFYGFARTHCTQFVKEQAERRKEKALSFFKRMPILEGLSQTKLLDLFLIFEVTRHKRGEYVFRTAGTGNSFFIVENGGALACRHVDSLTTQTISHYHPGDWFGELALMEDVPRQFDVVVETAMASFLHCDRFRFQETVGHLGVHLLLHHHVDLASRRASKESIRSRGSAIYYTNDIKQMEEAKKVTPSGLARGRNYVRKPRSRFADLHAEELGDGDGVSRQIGNVSEPSNKQKEDILQTLLKRKVFGDDVLSKTDLCRLAANFKLHRVDANDCLVQEGVDDGHDRQFFMLEFGDIKLYKHQKGDHSGRPHLKGYGTQITFYNKPFDLFGKSLMRLNDAPPTASIVCNKRTSVISVEMSLAAEVLGNQIKARRDRVSNIVRKVPFFHTLDDEHCELLVDVLGSYHYQQGDFVLQQGEISNEIYIVESGDIKVHGKKGVVTGTKGPGDTLYVMSLVEDCLVAGDFVAASPDLRVLGLKRHDFHKVLGKLVFKIHGQKGFMDPSACGHDGMAEDNSVDFEGSLCEESVENFAID